MKKLILLPYERYQRLLSTIKSSNVGEKAQVSASGDEQTIISSTEVEQKNTKESEVTEPKESV